MIMVICWYSREVNLEIHKDLCRTGWQHYTIHFTCWWNHCNLCFITSFPIKLKCSSVVSYSMTVVMCWLVSARLTLFSWRPSVGQSPEAKEPMEKVLYLKYNSMDQILFIVFSPIILFSQLLCLKNVIVFLILCVWTSLSSLRNW